jgi:hypothetical protein
MTSASERDTEEELIQTIKGIFIGNDLTDIGGAYHKIIEGEATVMTTGLVADNIFFTTAQALAALDFKARHKNLVHEVPVKKVYETSFGPILITGRVDGLDGREIQDTKCKFGFIDFQQYLDSYQWRFYEDMLDLDLLYYDVFEVRGFEEFGAGIPRTLPDVTFQLHDRLPCNRYSQLHDDCRSMVEDFLGYIDNRKFWTLLKVATEPAGAQSLHQ